MKKKSLVRILFISVIILGSLLAGPNLPAAQVAVWGDTNASAVPLPPGLVNVKAVAGGSGFSLALKTDGTVVAWGQTNVRNANALIVPPGLSNVTAIAVGETHALALTASGHVVAWGYGIFGETNVPVGLSKVTAVAAGGAHSLALKADGTLAAWGSGSSGVTNLPANLTDVKAIAAGGAHNVALKHDGTLTAWGWGSSVPAPAGLSNIIAIAAGSDFSLALQADGRVGAWGRNDYGQTNVPSGLNNVVAIAAGSGRGLALKSDGTVVVWGRVLAEPAVPDGLSNVLAIAAGGNHNLALVHAGPPQIVTEPQDQIAAYGASVTFSVSATGNNSLSYQWFRNGQPLSNNARCQGATTAMLTISNLVATDAGNYTVVVGNALGSVLSADATLTTGQAPVITYQTPDQTIGASTFVMLSVTAGGTPPLAYQWTFHGTNLPGRTAASLTLANAQPENSGDYTVIVSSVFGTASATIGLTVTNRPPLITQQPFLIATNLRGPMLYSPLPPGSHVALDVSATGSLPLRYQWRFNGVDLPGATNKALLRLNLTYAQSGYYSVEIRNPFGVTNSAKLLLNVADVLLAGSPGIFYASTNMPLALSNVTAVAAGGLHLLALKTDGTVRTWLMGNSSSQVAATLTNPPASATNLIAISAGYDHCLALRSNGTVVTWGSTPGNPVTNVPATLSNVVGIAAGQGRSYAVKADGTVTGWGSSAAVPAGLSNVVTLAAGPSQNLALRRDGTVVYWPVSSSTFTVVPGLSNAIAIANGSGGPRALRQDGAVVYWFGSATPSPVMQGNYPVSNAVAVAVGSSSATLILKADGTLFTALGSIQPPFPVTTNLIALAAGGYSSAYGVAMVGDGKPFFTLHPISQVVQKSNLVQLHARAVGAPLPPPPPREPIVPAMTFQWQHDGANLPGATNASLRLSNVQTANVGHYRLIASNMLGVATSRVATISIAVNTNLPAALNATNLTWTTLPQGYAAPWFAQNHETHDGDAAAQSGAISHNQQSVLQTTVTGPGTLSFWWKVSSEAHYDFLRLYWNNLNTSDTSISGETDWQQITLTLSPGSHTLRWVYSKDGSLSVGRDAGFLDEVRFIPAPAITSHPADRTVALGANVVYSVSTADRTSPMTYQWLKNGTNLPGATAQSLTLSNVTRRDSGSYAVRVSNDGGSVLSSNALLKVIAPQRLSPLHQLADGSVWMSSCDADGGLLEAQDFPAFEAQAGTNLTHWETLPGALSLTNGWLWLRDTNASRFLRRFYRVVELP